MSDASHRPAPTRRLGVLGGVLVIAGATFVVALRARRVDLPSGSGSGETASSAGAPPQAVLRGDPETRGGEFDPATGEANSDPLSDAGRRFEESNPEFRLVGEVRDPSRLPEDVLAGVVVDDNGDAVPA